jgi:DNA-nicking Smr family endonuclease
VVQLQCNHLSCAKCFVSYKHAIPENSKVPCSLCRREVEESFFHDALEEMVELSATRADMKERLSSLPLNCQADQLEVFRSLLVRHDLDRDAVLRSLDDIMYRNNVGNLWQSKNLSSLEKQTIYDDAWRPVQILEQEFKDTLELLDIGILDSDSSKFKEASNKLKDIEHILHSAKDNAEKEICSRLNASGSMGMENDNGEILLDFHGLHVKEAKDKIMETMLLPIISVVKSIVIITGHGIHFANNRSTLKPALQKYLTQKHKAIVEWEVVKKNSGAIRIYYNEAQSELLN